MAYSNSHNTRVWRALDDRGPRKGVADLGRMDAEGFADRVKNAVRASYAEMNTRYGKLPCKIIISIHAYRQFRNRGFSNEPGILIGDVADLLRIQEIAEKVSGKKNYTPIVVFDADTNVVYALCAEHDAETGTYAILLKTYFYMGFNSHAKFYVEDSASVCIKVENRYGLKKDMPKNRLTFGIENIPEFQLNLKYKENVAR